jgi:hypothetical protein
MNLTKEGDMRLRNTILTMAGALFAVADTRAAKMCMPCEVGTWSKIDGACLSIREFKASDFELVAKNAAGSDACNTGTLRPGLYRIVLGGGNGGDSGQAYRNEVGGDTTPGKLTYNFVLRGSASYELCAGGDGGDGKPMVDMVYWGGSGSGGAGSYMKIDFSGESYYFIASGGMGKYVHRPNVYYCAGGSGGGIGDGQTASVCLANDRKHYSAGNGPGGRNGGSNPVGQQSLKIRKFSSVGETEIDEAKNYGGDTQATSHATNVSDPDGCTQCAKLYRLK